MTLIIKKSNSQKKMVEVGDHFHEIDEQVTNWEKNIGRPSKHQTDRQMGKSDGKITVSSLSTSSHRRGRGIKQGIDGSIGSDLVSAATCHTAVIQYVVTHGTE